MPDVYEVPLPFSFHLAGAVAVGTTSLRKVIPFDHQVLGISATVNTAPTGAGLILDLLHGPYNTAASALTTLWPTSGNAGRPQIAAGAFDVAPKAPSTTTVTAQGTNPPGYTGTTTVNYNESPYLVRPDTPAATAGFGAAAATPTGGNNPGEPFNETGVSTGLVQGITETGMAPGSPNRAFSGSAGDVYQLAVVQVGATVAGSDLEFILYLLPS